MQGPGFAVLAVAATLVAAPSAQAALDVSAAPTQAGAHADVTISATFAQTPSSVVVKLPPGLVGNPNAVPRCSVATFTSLLGCPAETRVGTASATPRTLPLPATGDVYNLEPEPGEPARLGIDVGVLAIRVKNQASISLRADGGLDSTIAALDDGGLGIAGLDLTLGASFMRLPTSCAPARVSVVTPENGTDSASFEPTDCAAVPFEPAVSASLATPARAAPSGATVALTLPPDQADVRRAEIALPVGTALSPAVADGLTACADLAAGCPASSQIGSVEFRTPLLGTLTGKVYFALGSPFRLFVEIAGPGVSVKLTGDVRLDPATGQITTIFDELPQVPFTSFALTFQGGPHAVLITPPSCGSHALTARLTPWSGTPAKTVGGSFSVDQGCAAPAFAPSLSIAAASTAAGRPAGAVSLTIERPDGAEELSRVTTELPPGLAGSLVGIPVCADAAADAGACPADTRVGTVQALAGAGSAPVALAGSVSLTGPTDGGFAGLAMAIPGRVGPVDLGTVVVRASIALRPDGGLTVRTRPLPALVGGVPVSIRRFSLTLDRPGFILNASSCAAQQVHATVEGASGSTAALTAPYQATDCASLPFAPKLTATIGARGKTGKNKVAPLEAVVTVPAGHAATASADVGLPTAAIGLNLQRLAQACGPDAYAGGTCPSAARIGSATATTPLLDAPLTSPVTLAVRALGELPGLGLQLSGPVTLPLFGAITLPGADKLLHNRFDGIPDLPLGRFALRFNGPPLKLSRDVCHGKRALVRGVFTAHSGAVVRLSTPLKVAGCPPVATLKRRGGKLRLRVTSGRDGARVTRTTIRGKGIKRTVRTQATLRNLRRGTQLRLTVRDAARKSWTVKLRVRR